MTKEVMPLISIIVPVYNVEKYLSQCLDSLTNQTLRNIEIICVNDGSTDRSLDILKEYASKDNRIIVISQHNQGVSVARNIAMKHISGEYFMFVDSDDWLDVQTCEAIYKTIIKYNADCLMFSYTKEFANHSIENHIFNHDIIIWKEEVKVNFHRRLFGPVGIELSRPQNLDLLISACMQLFKSKKFSKIDFYDIKTIGSFEDGLFQMQVYNNCDVFVYLDKPFYHYRKTNKFSITTKYNKNLPKQWMNLYNIVDENIRDSELSNIYNSALQNRIALSIVPLGLNQTRSNDTILKGSKHLKQILSSDKYKQAIKNLDIKEMPILWKILFFFAKKNMTVSLFLMFKIIEYLRTHKNH